MPLFHHDKHEDSRKPDAAGAPSEAADPVGAADAADVDVPAGMVRSLYPEGGLEPDLIGDEWRQGTPDESVPEPNELEWDLAEAPGALLGGWGEVDPAPRIPMPEAKEHHGQDPSR